MNESWKPSNESATKELSSQIRTEYDNVVAKINEIDQKIAEYNLEKNLWIDTLRKFNPIINEPKEEELVEKEKENQIREAVQMLNSFQVIDFIPKSIYEFSRNEQILSEATHTLMTEKVKSIGDSCTNDFLNEIEPKVLCQKSMLTYFKPIQKHKNDDISASDLDSTKDAISE